MTFGRGLALIAAAGLAARLAYALLLVKSKPLLVDWERAVRLVPGVLPHTFVGGDGSAALMFQLGASQPAGKN